MLSSTPTFPPFEQWQSMSEADQDALIGRMETARRRQKSLRRLFVGITCATVTASVCAALYLHLLN